MNNDARNSLVGKVATGFKTRIHDLMHDFQAMAATPGMPESIKDELQAMETSFNGLLHATVALEKAMRADGSVVVVGERRS